MVLRVEQIEEILAPALDQCWLAGKAGRRQVSCVTLLERVDESDACRVGELVVLAPGRTGERHIIELTRTVAERQAAAVLIPARLLATVAQGTLRELAARHDLMIGLLAASADPRSVANALSRALGTARSETALAPLHGAETLQALAESLGHLVGNSVTIETPQHKLLAFSSTQGPVDRLREETILRRRADPRVMAWVASQGYIAEVRKSDRPVRIPRNPDFEFSGRVAMRVAAEDEVLAIIWVTDTARPLGERDVAAIEQAGGAAAAILVRQQAVAQKEAELRAEFLEDVIHGRITARENVRALARSMGWEIDRPQHALVVAIDRFEDFRLRHAGPGGRGLQRVRERLSEAISLETLAIDPEVILGPRSSGMVVLCNTGHGDEVARHEAALRLADRIVKRVGAMIPDMTVTVGVGRDAPSLDGMADSFRQAELAAQLGAMLWGGNRSIHYNDLGVHRVLYALHEQDEMIPPALQRIVEYDTRHHTDYVRTLATYFSCMGRLRAAATQLDIHRNTLEYRMNRIEELAGLSLDDPNNRLALELGIKLLDLKRRTTLSPGP